MKYKETKNKETKTAIKLKETIEKNIRDLKLLEANKDAVVLSKTCMTHLDDWIKDKYFGRPRNLKTDALEKGIECENEAVFILNKALGTNYKKSRYSEGEKMDNGIATGHEDIDCGIDTEGFGSTIDTKVCLTIDTFPILKEDVDLSYWRQGQGYMWLKGEEYKTHTVAKVLVNSPQWLVEKKLKNLYYSLLDKYGETSQYMEEEYETEAMKLFKSHVFDQQITVHSNGVELRLKDDEVIPYEKRVHLVTFERDDEAIEKITRRVEECRKYLTLFGY